MLTRIGDYAQNQLTTQLLLDAQSRARTAQIQISSGKTATSYSDIADGTSRLVSTQAALQWVQGFQTNNQLVSDRLDAMDSSTSSLVDIATRLKTLLIQRLNSGQGTVPGTITPDAQNMLQEAISALNVQVDGRYLFAGSKSDAPPVVLDPGYSAFGSPDDTYYQGDNIELTAQADTGVNLTYGMTANREGFQDLIGALRTVIEGDGSDDQTMLSSALDLTNSALTKITGYEGEIGARQSELGKINDGHADTELYLQRQVSDVEDVDLTEAISRLTQDQSVVEASLATIAQLKQMSLVDFLGG
jgi:flagellar hook-associated protein 3 FlgL